MVYWQWEIQHAVFSQVVDWTDCGIIALGVCVCVLQNKVVFSYYSEYVNQEKVVLEINVCSGLWRSTKVGAFNSHRETTLFCTMSSLLLTLRKVLYQLEYHKWTGYGITIVCFKETFRDNIVGIPNYWAFNNITLGWLLFVCIILISLFSKCRLFRGKQMPANRTWCLILMTDS